MNNLSSVISRILSAHRIDVPVSLSPSIGMLLLGVMNATSASAADPACAQMIGQACVISTAGTAGPPAAQPNPNGHPGGNGGTAGDINQTLTQPIVYEDSGNNSPLQVSAVGGAGAQGTDASKDTLNHSGGAGGIGGAGGNISLTTQGSQIGGFSSSATPALQIVSAGGAGGAAGAGSSQGTPGANLGVGGNAGTISATLDGSWTSSLGTGLYVQSVGGAGGRGRDSSASGFSSIAPDGANGGNAQDVNVTLQGVFQGEGGGTTATGTVAVGGTFISSVGGAGGNGGANGSGSGDEGGFGGNGGNAGNVTVTLAAGSKVVNADGDESAGLWALSAGGQGGVGGTGNAGGHAGAGGAAGAVNVILDGTAQSIGGYMSPAVLAQSIGGSGQAGGNGAGWFSPNGADGGAGGPANTVTVTGSGAAILTNGGNLAPGVLAQSIGGGGGTGGHSDGWFAVGGSGSNAANGASVTVNLSGSSITTDGLQSDGIAAQSIGGGGGKGGDAQGSGAGLNMTIGGTGGGGGSGSTVSIASGAGDIITTSGDHSTGILAQSIGGGGGDGGAAYGKVTSGVFGAQLSVGGSGGAGGDGGQITLVNGSLPTNAGQIITAGSDSFGILAQSIGGGGGRGGDSAAQAKVYGDGEYPSLSVAVAIGGKGGSGGSGSTVVVGNTGLISTSGAGAAGMVAQSVGGGGGSGGDASATSTASGGDVNITASVGLGGSSGGGGAGGNSTATNSGLIVTTGESADAMVVQSVGGGGGIGGTGDAKADASKGDTANISLTLAMGAAGGAGGSSGNVSATNAGGAIITLGDGAIGLGAQSVAGGGGRAGGGAGSTSGTYEASVTLGGSGGAGGTAGGATATNNLNSTIVTFGADAAGILVQSVGGGGGIGGKAATSLGTSKSGGDGSNSSSNTQTALSTVAANFNTNGNAAIGDYNTLNGAVSFANSLLNNKSVGAVGDDEGDLDDLAQSKGDTDDDNNSKSISLKVAVGGAGGVGGTGGSVVANNYGEVATTGHDSDAIIAQSVGGGGGKGGAAATASSNDYSGNVSVGGNGGAGANGGEVQVNNTGTIITEGALAAGILAQSVAGSGGIGGVAASSVSSNSKNSNNTSAQDGAFSQLNISLGGNGGGSGTSSQVYVTSTGAIITKAHDSIGIIAQSIAGGGGIVKSLATDLEGAGGSASAGETNFNLNFSFSGSNGAPGSTSSGLVNVSTQAGGTITTSGDNSYGILAQSISGGGGVALGGQVSIDPNLGFPINGRTAGSVIDDGVNNPASGNSGVFVNVGADISTSGKGAIGILAQSIGGGGGLVGNTGASENYANVASPEDPSTYVGNGGYVSVGVAAGATVSTSGANAPAIFVQSIGGGGGRVTTSSAAYWGTAGGTGQGGPINIDINGTVQATGAGSAGIVAQSEGNTAAGAYNDSPINVTIGSTGKVVVGQSNVPTAPNGEGAAIYIDHGGLDAAHANTVSNDGYVYSYGSVSNAVAVYSNGGYTQVVNNGTLGGDVLLTNNGGSGCFTNNGTFDSGNAVTVGSCGVTNSGVMNIGGVGSIANTAISGNFTQRATGRLNIDANLQGGIADALTVNGKVSLGGVIYVNPTSISNQAVTVLTATGGITVSSPLQEVDNSTLFNFPVVVSGNELKIEPIANFNASAANLGSRQRAVASYLQQLFDSGASFDNGFMELAKLPSGTAYSQSLKSMSGDVLGAFGAFRVNSSQAFAYNLYQGCRELTTDLITSDSCSWARASGGSTDQSARGGRAGYQANAYTVDFGGQVGLSDRWALVGSLGYESNGFTSDDVTSHIEGNAALAGVGMNFADGPLELSAAMDGAYGWYRSYRTITVGAASDQANANPRQWQIGLHLRGGYEIATGGVSYIKPFLDGHVIRVSNDSFTEDGNSPFRLTVNGRSENVVQGGPGLEWGFHIPTRFGLEVHPFLSGAVEFGQNAQWTTTAHFAGQSAAQGFDVASAGPGTLAKFGVGADLVNAKNLSFSILYEPEFGDGYRYEGGAARINYRF